jgi:ribosomal protein S18 acetylase RimI-like enzyme
MPAPTERASVEIRPASPADAPALAALHAETLPGDVSDFTPLGAAVVRRFYANAIARGVARVWVAPGREGGLDGFVMSTRDIAALFPRALLAGPGDVLRFVLSANPLGLARAAFAKLASGTAAVAAVPELVYLAVASRARGRGLGAALIAAVDQGFRADGIDVYELNVHADNAAAVKLYLGSGFEIARRYAKGGHEMYAMRRRLA